jgi:predicted nucleotidyltransferase
MNQYKDKYLKRTVRFSGILQCVPFLRAIILNGSLAGGNIKESSDIDLLIIARSGRIYTTRFFVNLLGNLLGEKRSKNEEKSHAGKFCFNYFLTDGYLKIPTGRGEKMDKYCAMNYSRSVLLWGDDKLFDKFLAINSDLFAKFGCFSSLNDSKELEYYFPARSITFLLFIRKMQEIVFGGMFGNWIERRLKHLQIKMIESDPRTSKFPSLIVYNDQEARFHPPKNL